MNTNDYEFNKFVASALPHYMSRTLATALMELRFNGRTTTDVELNLFQEDTTDTGVKVTEHYKKTVVKLLRKLVSAMGSKAAALEYLRLAEEHHRELEVILVLRNANSIKL
jgi:hypothetical protein